MLHINGLTYRIEGKPILEGATVAVPAGHKVGLVGRNGAGKSTLIRLITGDLTSDDGDINVPRGARIGHVAQEAPGGDDSLIDWVVGADRERAALLAEAETATDPQRIADIQTRLADMGAHAAPARAATILAGLGFDEAAQQRPCRDFSGGWRMRVALAAVLFLEPDVLLLDEPTNYLDLEGTLWLEAYLRAYPHTIVVVSHDRDLLNRVVDAIVHLDRGRLTLYAGGYDAFEEARREQQRLDAKHAKEQDVQRRHIEAFIARFKAKASKAAQAQSRIKALARMKPIAATVDQRVAPIILPSPEKALASPLIKLDRAAAGYGGVTVLHGLDLRIDHADRIALLGSNGNGKSTFAKLISGRMKPMSGDVVASSKLSIGYFAQHQLDELPGCDRPFDVITRLMPEASESERRTKLGTYGFSADKADTLIENLSGGEKARLLLMVAAFHAPHLLILDEPTNHLDVDSREALVHALNDYDGAVILISHDRHLIDAVADRLWLVADGTVRAYDGDLETYRTRLIAERSTRARTASTLSDTGGPSRADQRRLAAERRASLAPLKKVVVGHEREIDRLQAELARLDAELADPALYADRQRAEVAVRTRGVTAKLLAEVEELWLAATEALESADV
jgi:ATP-binding cassette subfamily F protein 3